MKLRDDGPDPLTIYRVNKYHTVYTLQSLDGGTRTAITRGGRTITVNIALATLNRAWNRWTQRDYSVREAFAFLTSAEREFLDTGILTEDWLPTDASYRR